ncbi:MAG: response regulator [Brevundimonas sp.]|nr:response regulator [Brevundimonas sp.]
MLAHAVRTGHARRNGVLGRWALGAALVAGLSAWGAQLMALMAFDAGMPVHYDPIGIVAALGVSVGAVFLSFHVCSEGQPMRMLASVAIRSVGYLLMHVLAVCALRTGGIIHWSMETLALAFAVHLALSLEGARFQADGKLLGTVSAGITGWAGLTALYLISMSGFWISPGAPDATVMDGLSRGDMLTWAIGAVMILCAGLGGVAAAAYWSRSKALHHLRTAIEAMPDGLGFYDTEDRLLLWNDRYVEVNAEIARVLRPGVSFIELLQEGLRQNLYAHAVGREAEWLAERLAARREAAGSFEQEIGGDRWLRVQDRRTSDGGTVTIVTDITELKQDARDLAEARDVAEQANRSKSQFLANMSHEIRTPLNGVIGLTEALGRTPLNPQQREMLDLMASSGRTLQTLLGDILDLARVESGRMQLVDEAFDLAKAVQEAGQLYEATAREKGLGFVVDIAPEARVWVMGDVVRLKQVLTNLVSNAVKFTDTGFVTLRAEAGPTRAGAPTLRMTVEDTGIGFDPETRTRLFTRFEQADGGIARRFGGTGLGLAICRQLAELMGGDLDCESELGGGSAFILTLPLQAVAAPETPETPEIVPASTAAMATAPLRVLLADDHPTNRKVVELVLAAARVELVSVENGAQAVEAFAAGTFDLVLMDMQMPVMDGLAATRELRRLEAAGGRPRARIVMLTANALPEHVAAGQAAGADGHVAKPFNTSELLALVCAPAAGEAAKAEAAA